MKLPCGFYYPGAGTNLCWRDRGVYTDEIKCYITFNSFQYQYNANRFRNADNEIIKEKKCDSLEEAIKFLGD